MTVLPRAELDGGRDLGDHELVREVAVVALRWNDRSPLAQETRAALVELIDERPVIGARAFALLVRPRKVEVGLAREEIETARQRLRVAANKGVNVIARQVAVPSEQLEYLYIALGRVRDNGFPLVDDRIARPS